MREGNKWLQKARLWLPADSWQAHWPESTIFGFALIVFDQDSILDGGLLILAFRWDLQKNPQNNLQSNLITF